ncbi:hypothetical protein LX16_1740 [Stackebrandtia albiflava]|uniref:Uncharacterized protein n=1 Tax=Stackebrandtia albiflava TaxID=406432 RepID=A0A562VDR9_9ACTN|nr:hypothetical protein [Stackebrandtia albiflava]TWJ16020.1 hypothetical protein LX16_1740 [Stackebrandtia albiflava]
MTHRDGAGPRGHGRAELVRQYVRIRRLRLATLATVLLAAAACTVVVAGFDALTRDPAFTALDELELPEWAASEPEDAADGSRWCLHRCRIRERVWQSGRPVAETADAYAVALRTAGWRPVPEDCPATDDAVRQCLRRDEFFLDLWMRGAGCDPDTAECRFATVAAVVTAASEVADAPG